MCPSAHDCDPWDTFRGRTPAERTGKALKGSGHPRRLEHARLHHDCEPIVSGPIVRDLPVGKAVEVHAIPAKVLPVPRMRRPGRPGSDECSTKPATPTSVARPRPGSTSSSKPAPDRAAEWSWAGPTAATSAGVPHDAEAHVVRKNPGLAPSCPGTQDELNVQPILRLPRAGVLAAAHRLC